MIHCSNAVYCCSEALASVLPAAGARAADAAGDGPAATRHARHAAAGHGDGHGHAARQPAADGHAATWDAAAGLRAAADGHAAAAIQAAR